MIRKNIASVALLIAVLALMAVQACADDPEPTSTPVPVEAPSATNTPMPVPTDTPEPVPTNTPVPVPTDTPVPVPTDTPVPVPTDTPVPAPTDTPEPEPTDTPTPDPTNTPVPPPTLAPEPTATTAPEPAPMPEETALTVDEYIEVCSSFVGPFASAGVPPGISNAALSEIIGNFHMLFSDLNPPPEIAEWHDVQLDLWVAMREALDDQPADNPFDPILLIEPLFANFGTLMSVQIDPELVDRLNAAGCTGNFVDLEELTMEEPPVVSEPMAETSADVLAEVEEFAAGCAGLAQLSSGPQPGATYGETSEGVGLIIGVLGALEPPAVLLDWHTAQLAMFEGVKELADAEPADEPLDQSKLFALIPLFQAVEAAIGELSADVEAILVGASCIAE